MSDKLINTFLAEANELIVDIERCLLDVGRNSEDQENFSAIFRAMHTLKGASGMFGFERVQRLTHHLENIYQDIRDGKRLLDDEISDLTFKTLDQLRILLNGSNSDTEPAGYSELLEAVMTVCADQHASAKSDQTTSAPRSSGETTYYIKFSSHQDIIRNGTNPLYLIDDVLVLGSGISFPFFQELPTLQQLSTDKSYIGFEVILLTDKTEEEIQTVFLFVEGQCELTIHKLAVHEQAVKEILHETDLFADRDQAKPIGLDQVRGVLEKKHARRVTDIANKSVKAKGGNIRVDSHQLDELMNLVSELVTTQARLSLFANNNSSNELAGISENIEKITRRLRDNAFTMSLVPFESIRVRFQRMVAELSKELDKSIDFVTDGMDTKIDKSIIEKLIDPILHILRNCIDHGIETPEIRIANGKAAKGILSLKAFYSGSSVVIEISDDGAGINLPRIREKAISRGLISNDAQLTDREITDLIFLPGLSTAANVTDVSGRGVGMDVVKRNIADIRGEVEVVTTDGKGTRFTIKLPLTLSILDGLLVKIGSTDFILPLSAVIKCHEVQTTQLENAFNQWVTLDGKRTPFIYLREVFGITKAKPVFSQIINVPYNGDTVGLAVDHIVGEYQAVLKPLGNFYSGQDEFSGATILGDGTVALVFDPTRVISKSSSVINHTSHT
jgi:two-component system, chemotaxis family, sensor kinase CheA